MTKETYREIEALAVEAVKRGLAENTTEGQAADIGLRVLKTLHEIRFPQGLALLPNED